MKRRQFPLKLAAAEIIHKARESTLQTAVFHYGPRKRDHIHFVGLSRITNIDKLHFLDLNEKKISVIFFSRHPRYSTVFSCTILYRLFFYSRIFFYIRAVHTVVNEFFLHRKVFLVNFIDY